MMSPDILALILAAGLLCVAAAVVYWFFIRPLARAARVMWAIVYVLLLAPIFLMAWLGKRIRKGKG